MNSDPYTIWKQLTSGYTANSGLTDELWNELWTAYTGENRYYHNLSHLEYLFILTESVQGELENVDALFFAIYYHDAVYDPERKDNEEKSAELADERLKEVGVDRTTRDRCIRHVLATKDHMKTDDPDTNYLLDMDLAILGSDRDIYDRYNRNIRREFGMYPDNIFNAERKRILEAFLKRDRIFHTDHFHKLFEEKARQNIRRDLGAF